MTVNGNQMQGGVELNEKGRQCLEAKDLTGALNHFIEALDLLIKPEQAPVRAGMLNNIGHVVNSLGRSDEALAAFRQATDIYEKLEDAVALGWQLSNIGSVMRDRSEHIEAVRMYEQALAAFTLAGDEPGQSRPVGQSGLFPCRSRTPGAGEAIFYRSPGAL